MTVLEALLIDESRLLSFWTGDRSDQPQLAVGAQELDRRMEIFVGAANLKISL
jgi:hypothetical protein